MASSLHDEIVVFRPPVVRETLLSILQRSRGAVPTKPNARVAHTLPQAQHVLVTRGSTEASHFPQSAAAVAAASPVAAARSPTRLIVRRRDEFSRMFGIWRPEAAHVVEEILIDPATGAPPLPRSVAVAAAAARRKASSDDDSADDASSSDDGRPMLERNVTQAGSARASKRSAHDVRLARTALDSWGVAFAPPHSLIAPPPPTADDSSPELASPWVPHPEPPPQLLRPHRVSAAAVQDLRDVRAGAMPTRSVVDLLEAPRVGVRPSVAVAAPTTTAWQAAPRATIEQLLAGPSGFAPPLTAIPPTAAKPTDTRDAASPFAQPTTGRRSVVSLLEASEGPAGSATPRAERRPAWSLFADGATPQARLSEPAAAIHPITNADGGSSGRSTVTQSGPAADADAARVFATHCTEAADAFSRSAASAASAAASTSRRAQRANAQRGSTWAQASAATELLGSLCFIVQQRTLWWHIAAGSVGGVPTPQRQIALGASEQVAAVLRVQCHELVQIGPTQQGHVAVACDSLSWLGHTGGSDGDRVGCCGWGWRAFGLLAAPLCGYTLFPAAVVVAALRHRAATKVMRSYASVQQSASAVGAAGVLLRWVTQASIGALLAAFPLTTSSPLELELPRPLSGSADVLGRGAFIADFRATVTESTASPGGADHMSAAVPALPPTTQAPPVPPPPQPTPPSSSIPTPRFRYPQAAEAAEPQPPALAASAVSAGGAKAATLTSLPRCPQGAPPLRRSSGGGMEGGAEEGEGPGPEWAVEIEALDALVAEFTSLTA